MHVLTVGVVRLRAPIRALSYAYHVDLGVTWHFEIQLTWNFFNSLSNLVGTFFQLTSKFCNSLFDLGLNSKIVLSHSKRKQVHAIAIMTPSITLRIVITDKYTNYHTTLTGYTANTHRVTAQ